MYTILLKLNNHDSVQYRATLYDYIMALSQRQVDTGLQVLLPVHMRWSFFVQTRDRWLRLGYKGTPTHVDRSRPALHS